VPGQAVQALFGQRRGGRLAAFEFPAVEQRIDAPVLFAPLVELAVERRAQCVGRLRQPGHVAPQEIQQGEPRAFHDGAGGQSGFKRLESALPKERFLTRARAGRVAERTGDFMQLIERCRRARRRALSRRPLIEVELQPLPLLCGLVALLGALEKASPVARRDAMPKGARVVFHAELFKFCLTQPCIGLARERWQERALQPRCPLTCFVGNLAQRDGRLPLGARRLQEQRLRTAIAAPLSGRRQFTLQSHRQ
jgi:hypothetical protein